MWTRHPANTQPSLQGGTFDAPQAAPNSNTNFYTQPMSQPQRPILPAQNAPQQSMQPLPHLTPLQNQLHMQASQIGQAAQPGMSMPQMSLSQGVQSGNFSAHNPLGHPGYSSSHGQIPSGHSFASGGVSAGPQNSGPIQNSGSIQNSGPIPAGRFQGDFAQYRLHQTQPQPEVMQPFSASGQNMGSQGTVNQTQANTLPHTNTVATNVHPLPHVAAFQTMSPHSNVHPLPNAHSLPNAQQSVAAQHNGQNHAQNNAQNHALFPSHVPMQHQGQHQGQQQGQQQVQHHNQQHGQQHAQQNMQHLLPHQGPSHQGAAQQGLPHIQPQGHQSAAQQTGGLQQASHGQTQGHGSVSHHPQTMNQTMNQTMQNGSHALIAQSIQPAQQVQSHHRPNFDAELQLYVGSKQHRDLLERMKGMKRTRFNAHARLEHKHKVSIFTLSLISLFVVAISLYALTYSPVLPSSTKSAITFASIISSIFIIIVGLLESQNNYQVRALQMQRCAMEIADLYQKLQIETSLSRDDLQAYADRYQLALQSCPYNHDDIDFLMSKISGPRSLEMSWDTRIKIYASYYMDVYGLNCLILFIPPVILFLL